MERVKVKILKEKEGFLISLQDDTPTFFLPPPPFSHYFERGQFFSGLAEMKQIGYMLFLAIFNKPERLKFIKDFLSDPSPKRHLTLVILSDELEAHQLPWEVLFEKSSGHFLLRTGKVSLYHSLQNPPPMPREPSLPLKLLLVLSLPLEEYHKHPISLLEEWEMLYQNVFKEWVDKGLLEVTVEERSSPKVMRELLSEGGFHLFHFVGHGGRDGHLLLESSEGPEKPPVILEREEAEDLFFNKGLVGAFFNACETGSASILYPDLLYTLQAKCSLPLAVGYQGRISDVQAVEIARLFYQALLKGGELPQALNSIRRKMDLSSEWWRVMFWLSPQLEGLQLPYKAPKRKAKRFFFKELLPIGDDFVYRYGVLRKTGEALRSPRTRVILLYGLAGSGKSLAASYIAKFYRHLFQYVVPIPCRRNTSPLEVLQTLSQILSLPGGQNLERQWRRIVSSQKGPLLLILDDFDELLAEDGLPGSQEWQQFLELLLNTEWNGKALFTSQALFRLPSWKPGFTPGSLQTLKVGEFAESETDVFLRYHLTSELLESREFQRFRRENVGGHPLSLSLLSSRIKKYGWEHVKKLSPFLPAELEERLQRYEKVFSPEERAQLLKLAVIPRPFPADYLSEALAKETQAKLEMWGLLERVDEKGLLLPRAFAGYLVSKAAAEELRQAALAGASFFQKKGEELQSLSLHINAFYLFLKSGQKEEAGRLIDRMLPYLQAWGKWEEAENMLQKLLLLQKQRGDRRGEAVSLHSLGILARDQGRLEEAERLFKDSLKIFMELGDKGRVAASLHQLGILAQLQGELKEAERLFQRTKEIFAELGDKGGEAASLHQLGILTQDQGRLEEAERFFQESLKIFVKLGDKEGEAASLHQLGILAQDQGKPDAKELFQKSKEIFAELGDKRRLAASLGHLGLLAQDQGKLEEAGELFKESLKIFRELGDKGGEAISLHNLGILAQNQGKPDAKELFQKSKEIFAELRDKRGLAVSLHHLGMLAQEQGNLEEAESLFKDSLKIAEELGDKEGEAASLHHLGILARFKGRLEEAERFFKNSLKIFKKLGDKREVAASLHQLGVLAQHQGRSEKAERLFKDSLKIKKELGDKGGVATSLHHLGILAQEQGKLEEAERLFQDSLKISEELKDMAGAALSRGSLAGVYLQRWREEKEEEALQKALEYLLRAFEDLYHLHNPQVEIAIRGLLKLKEGLGEKFEEIAFKVNPPVYRLFEQEVLQRLSSR